MLYLKKLAAALAGLIVVLVLAWAQPSPAQLPPDFQGRYIAAISDADMRAYAYIDGQLGEPRGTDQLSIVTLPLPDNPALTSSIEVSNSVMNPVYSLVASQDGNTIFVAETKEPREPEDQVIGDLDLGTILRAVDVSDPAMPRVIAEVEVGIDPQGVSLDASGTTLALATKEPDAPLTFVTFTEGRFGEPIQLPMRGFSPMAELPDGGMLPHHVEWHPTADIVAVNVNFRGQVQFFRVVRDAAGSVSDVVPWGNRVITSKWPMSGKFSRDGRFYVTNDLQWGVDVRGFYVNAPPSQLTVIELAPLDQDEAQHFVVGGVSLPRHAESIAFSNDGTLIATSNIGQTWLSPEEPGYSQSSLSLVRFDPASGQLTHAGDWTFDGILPEGIAFDATDQYVVAGVFEYETPEPRNGALEFWRVVENADMPSLERTDYVIETGPGAHSLIVVQ
ncbi:beta-propeller fold lactonase family protein [filamentous cyanobacterium LEGE 07170]|nr:beta-propeller fold lactonase family protein [filamentous cyanobacterium LEGE 07170]